jgi:hypothetical protein
MGLDWNPGPKAKPGCETEFEKLWHDLQRKSCLNRPVKVRRFGEITRTAFDTLNAPTVGTDPQATEWAHRQFERRINKALTEEQFVGAMNGFRVLELAPKCDGLPRYTNGSPGGYVEAYAFRGQFLRDCTEIIGEQLVDSAWGSKPPLETITYGHELLARTGTFAATHGIDLGTVQTANDPDSTGFHLDVVNAAGRWCVFWGQLGHWLEAYF